MSNMFSSAVISVISFFETLIDKKPAVERDTPKTIHCSETGIWVGSGDIFL